MQVELRKVRGLRSEVGGQNHGSDHHPTGVLGLYYYSRSITLAADATARSGFAAFRKDCAPGENGGGDSVFGAARVFVSGSG